MNWTDYIIQGNPDGIDYVLEEHDLPATTSDSQYPDAILELIDESGDDAFNDLMRIHPDFDIIKEIVEKDIKLKEEKPPVAAQATQPIPPTIIIPNNNTPKVGSLQMPEITSQTKDIILIALMALLIYKLFGK